MCCNPMKAKQAQVQNIFTFDGCGLVSALPSSLSEESVEELSSSSSSSVQSSELSSGAVFSSTLLAKLLRRPSFGLGGTISRPSHQKFSLQTNFFSTALGSSKNITISMENCAQCKKSYVVHVIKRGCLDII